MYKYMYRPIIETNERLLLKALSVISAEACTNISCNSRFLHDCNVHKNKHTWKNESLRFRSFDKI